ncbi:hypothetical protein [Streptomyces sp. NPDC000851]
MTGIELGSVAFDDQAAIPRRHSGEGDDVSPPLTWSAVPDGTSKLVLLCEDPDADLDAWLPHLRAGGEAGPAVMIVAEGGRMGEPSLTPAVWRNHGRQGPSSGSVLRCDPFGVATCR